MEKEETGWGSDADLSSLIEPVAVASVDDLLEPLPSMSDLIGEARPNKTKPRSILVKVRHEPNLVVQEEKFAGYSVHLACQLEKPWVEKGGSPNSDTFRMEIPLPEGPLPYDASIVLQQFVDWTPADRTSPESKPTMNAAGSAIIAIRDLVLHGKVENQPVILWPAVFSGIVPEMCVKATLHVELVEKPAFDVKFSEADDNTWCEANQEKIFQRVVAFQNKTLDAIKTMQSTIEELANLVPPLYLPHGVPMIPVGFACVPAAPPTAEYWKNAANVAVLRCFPSDSIETSTQMFWDSTPDKKAEAALMMARCLADHCQYTPDQSPVSLTTTQKGNNVVAACAKRIMTRPCIEHARRLCQSSHLSEHYVSHKPFKSLSSPSRLMMLASIGKQQTRAEARIGAKDQQPNKQGEYQQISYEDFSTLAARSVFGMLFGDCEDSGMLNAQMLHLMQRSKDDLGELGNEMRRLVQDKSSLFLLMAVNGYKSEASQKEAPKGGHALAAALNRQKELERLEETVMVTELEKLQKFYAVKAGSPTSDEEPLVFGLMEGTAPIKSNVTDETRIGINESAVKYFLQNERFFSNMSLQRDSIISSKRADPFYYDVRHIIDVNLARSGFNKPISSVIDKDRRIGSLYPAFVGASKEGSYLWPHPGMQDEDYKLMKHLSVFATPHPELSAPEERYQAHSPVAHARLAALSERVNAHKRDAPRVHPMVLLLPERFCNEETILGLEKLVDTDKRVIKASVFNSSATPDLKQYQINLFISY